MFHIYFKQNRVLSPTKYKYEPVYQLILNSPRLKLLLESKSVIIHKCLINLNTAWLPMNYTLALNVPITLRLHFPCHTVTFINI